MEALGVEDGIEGEGAVVVTRLVEVFVSPEVSM